MPEIAPIAEGGFFTQANPDILAYSLECSNRMHQDPAVENVFSVMKEEYGTLAARIEGDRSSAELNAAEIVRGSVVRVFAHRLAMQLAPVASSLLEGDERVIDDLLANPLMRIVESPRTGVRTDFARVWYGDDARLLVGNGLIMQEAVRRTYAKMPSGLKAGILRAGIRVADSAQVLRDRRGLEEKQGEPVINGHWSHGARGAFVIQDDSERGRWQERFLLDCLARGNFTMEAGAFLVHNSEAATEHINAFLTDAAHGVADEQRGKDFGNDLLRAVLAKLHLPSLLAFMGNLVNIEAEYKNRYLAEERPDDPGSFYSPRQPLVTVSPTQPIYTIERNPASPYAGSTRGKRNRCPGPDALAPDGEAEIQANEGLRKAIKAVIPDASTETLNWLNRDWSEVDIITALGAGVARALIRRGYVRLDKKDVVSNLVPPHRIRSTGGYILSQGRN